MPTATGGKFAKFARRHFGDAIKVGIDQDVAAEEENAIVCRGSLGTDLFRLHRRLAIEGEGSVSASGVLEARGLDGELTAIITRISCGFRVANLFGQHGWISGVGFGASEDVCGDPVCVHPANDLGSRAV